MKRITLLALGMVLSFAMPVFAQDCDNLDVFDASAPWALQEGEYTSLPWFDDPDYLRQFYDSLLQALEGSSPGTRVGLYGEVPLFRVPVRFWVYRDDQGGRGGLSFPELPTDREYQLLLDNVNQGFIENGVRIQLYLHSFGFIDDTEKLRDLSGFTRMTLAGDHRKPGVLNVHITAQGNGLQVGLNRAIFIPRGVYDDADQRINTMMHEVGHYFGLPHTHFGSSCFAEKVNRGTYVKLGCSIIPLRWCSRDGDLFCDTPADPNMSTLPEQE